LLEEKGSQAKGRETSEIRAWVSCRRQKAESIHKFIGSVDAVLSRFWVKGFEAKTDAWSTRTNVFEAEGRIEKG